MTRRSPIRHQVHEHYRDGQLIHDYKRGKGKREEKQRRVVGSTPRGFTVMLNGQSFRSDAQSVTGAIQAAFSEYSGDAPKRMTIRRGG